MPPVPWNHTRNGGFMSGQDQFSDLLLSEVATAALQLAAANRLGGKPLDTATLLQALANTDLVGRWDRILLNDSMELSDPDSYESGSWSGVPLTASCQKALQLAAKIATSYRLLPVPPGALALGLVADPSTAAAQMPIGI